MARITHTEGVTITTPEQELAALDKIAQLKTDPAFIERYTSNNPTVREQAINEMLVLQGTAHGNDSNFGDNFTGTASRRK